MVILSVVDRTSEFQTVTIQPPKILGKHVNMDGHFGINLGKYA